jgi:hypothetical protein
VPSYTIAKKTSASISSKPKASSSSASAAIDRPQEGLDPYTAAYGEELSVDGSEEHYANKRSKSSKKTSNYSYATASASAYYQSSPSSKGRGLPSSPPPHHLQQQPALASAQISAVVRPDWLLACDKMRERIGKHECVDFTALSNKKVIADFYNPVLYQVFPSFFSIPFCSLFIY